MKKFKLFVGLLLIATELFAQNFNYTVTLEEIQIQNLGGIQSFAHASYQNKFLIIGGRLDGLHRRQPFASFDLIGHNNQLILIDPINKQVWKKDLSTLLPSIQEQLSSTNMQYVQIEDYVYLFGGYGYSNTAVNHISFPYVTTIYLPGIINAIINNTSISLYIRQIQDADFAITGGQLRKINNTFYLVGGQKFDGRYNPMGNPSFTQTYIDGYWKFNIVDDGSTFQIVNKNKITNAELFHRRDYNAVAQILPNGMQGITAFSGVFQPQADIPYLNSVTIDSNSFFLNTNFSQYYNHYHCANIALYDELRNEMHTLFFGGIAQYFDSAGILVQDNSVPFVKTIARVSRNANNEMIEVKLPTEMPGYLGAGAEFLQADNLETYTNEVLKLHKITADTTVLGYIYGGINSTAKNIFWINDGTQSSANANMYKINLIKNTNTSSQLINKQSNNNIHLQLYPNPAKSKVHVYFSSLTESPVKIELYNEDGKLIFEKNTGTKIGNNEIVIEHDALQYIGVYYIYISVQGNRVMQKLLIEE
jgi:Secretion system C-terminal sorting domain